MESRTITDLPEPIVMDILSSKLSSNAGAYAKHGSIDLLLDPHFANIHFSRAPTQILGTPSGYNDHLFIGELDESLLSRDKKDIRVCPKFMSIIKTFPHWESDVANIANGFVCLVNGWNPCRILNPITDERLEADIYRLSTNSWRSIGEAPSGILSFLGPFVNGALHSWSSNVGDSIFSFDVEEEKFQTVPAPPLKEEEKRDYEYVTLELLEGCLCMSYHKRYRYAFDIWVMNEYGVRDSWTKQYVIDNIIEASYYKAYRLTKNREILVLCADVFLISYDLKGRSSRYITFQGSSKKSHDFMFPFVPNFLRVQTKDRLEGTESAPNYISFRND
ncbi:hypothetical protein LguiB_002011 [Lonicera macranthoides]